MKSDLGEDATLLDELGQNPLPDSIKILLKPISDFQEFRESYLSLSVIEDSASGQDWVDKLMKLMALSRRSGMAILILLGVANLIIIANAIQLTVFARRNEIEIMRLVGATNWFIRTPFLLEGVIQGLVGALLATFMLGLGYQIIEGRAQDFLPGLQLLSFYSDLLHLHLKLVFLGVILGLLGSLLSLRKFLV